MRDRGLSPATVAKHYRSLQQLFKWLADDGEITRSPHTFAHDWLATSGQERDLMLEVDVLDAQSA
ncbi:MAG: hypothetical protein ABI418_11805 [Jatrophihabitantaceae bacterium]